MATITTFSTLKSAVADWLDRTDMSAVGGPIDTMIAMAEDRLYRDLRLRFMETATTATVASGVVAIPSDWLETKQAHVLSGSVSYKLEPKPAEWVYGYYPDRSSSGIPSYMAQEGDNFIFGPYPDSDYTVQIQYYGRPTALSTSNETNWLTTNASDVLLNAILLESVSFLGMDERVPVWSEGYSTGVKDLKREQKNQRFGREQSLRIVPA